MPSAEILQRLCRGTSIHLRAPQLIALIPNFQLSNPPPLPSTAESDCKLCTPIPCDIETDKIPTVMMFPMKKGKKASRVEEESVCVVQWRGNGDQRRWLFIKRPEKGECGIRLHEERIS